MILPSLTRLRILYVAFLLLKMFCVSGTHALHLSALDKVRQEEECPPPLVVARGRHDRPVRETGVSQSLLTRFTEPARLAGFPENLEASRLRGFVTHPEAVF